MRATADLLADPPAQTGGAAPPRPRGGQARRTLYIHVGAHKAGSTSLQRGLMSNADKLAGCDALYLATGRPEEAHHHVAFAAQDHGDERSRALFQNLGREIGQSAARNLFISAEGLEFLTDPGGLAPFAALKREHNLDIVVIFLVRHHGEQINSAYVEVVREFAYNGKFELFARPRLNKASRRYRDAIEFWSQLADRMLVKEFSALGVETMLREEIGLAIELPHANASINPLAVEALRLTIASITDQTRRIDPALRAQNEDLAAQLCARAARFDRFYKKFWGFTPWQYEKLMLRCADDLDYLRERCGIVFTVAANRQRSIVLPPYRRNDEVRLRYVLGA